MKKINFVRTDSHKKSLGLGWRKPRGLQNKRRLRKRGYAPVVKSGYQKDNKVKGLVMGLKPVIVSTVLSLSNIDKKTQGVIVSGRVGSKRRLEILLEIKKLGLKVLNLDVEKKIKAIEDSIKERKDLKEAKEKASAKKKQDKEAKAKEAKEKKEKEKEAKKVKNAKDESEVVDEKKAQKKELDKVLTKKGNQI